MLRYNGWETLLYGLPANFGETPWVNCTNILWAQLRQFPCANKKCNLHFKHKKALRKTFVQKSIGIKCWWNRSLVMWKQVMKTCSATFFSLMTSPTFCRNKINWPTLVSDNNIPKNRFSKCKLDFLLINLDSKQNLVVMQSKPSRNIFHFKVTPKSILMWLII